MKVMPESLAESIARSPCRRNLLEGFDSHATAKLMEFGIEAWFSPDSLIFQVNDHSGQFFLICEGTVAIEQPLTNRTVRIETLSKGDFMGWSALLGSGTRHFQARAITHVAAITFDGALLREACEKDPRFGYALMHRLLLIVTERLDATRERLRDVEEGRTDR
jgi:CRP/FNR family transcriptional regulator, cyclic AMP receptor protein